MEQTYRLSPGAVLYVVLRLHKSGIYGLLDVFSAIPDAQFPTCIQNAEQELMETGLGSMDFDGGFSLEEAFADAVAGCADETCVLLIDRRQAGRQNRMTCYLHQNAALTQDGPDCILRTGIDIPAAVVEFLGLPAGCVELEEIRVDSGLIARQDVSGLTEAGCTGALARLITRSASGEGGYAQLLRIVNRIQTELLALAWGEEGAVTVDVEYTEDQELFRLTPVTAESAGKRIAALAAV